MEQATIQPQTYTSEETACKLCGIALRGEVVNVNGGDQTLGYDAYGVCRSCFVTRSDELTQNQYTGPQPCWTADTPDEILELYDELTDGGENAVGHPVKKYREDYGEREWGIVREFVRRGYKFEWHPQSGHFTGDTEPSDFLPFPYKPR